MTVHMAQVCRHSMYVSVCVYVISHICHLLFLAEQIIIKIPFGSEGLTQWLKCLQHKQKDESSNPWDPCKCQVNVSTSLPFQLGRQRQVIPEASWLVNLVVLVNSGFD